MAQSSPTTIWCLWSYLTKTLELSRRVMSFPCRQNSMSAFLSSPLLFSFFARMASSSQRCFRPRSNRPTWSHIIKQLWGKLIPSESLVFHTFQFKAITHSGLLLQRGLCQAPHHCPPPHPPPFIHPPSQAIPRVSSVTHHPSTSILIRRVLRLFFFSTGLFCASAIAGVCFQCFWKSFLQLLLLPVKVDLADLVQKYST